MKLKSNRNLYLNFFLHSHLSERMGRIISIKMCFEMGIRSRHRADNSLLIHLNIHLQAEADNVK